MAVLLHVLQAVLLATAVSVSLAVEYTVQWTIDGVANYSERSPLMVALGDKIVFVCPTTGFSNIIVQTHRDQYDQCDVTATEGQHFSVGQCAGALALPSYDQDIRQLSGGLDTAISYDPGNMYYFTSYATGSFDSVTESTTRGGQCLDGLKMAISVAPKPVTVTVTVSPTPTPNDPKGNREDKGSSSSLSSPVIAGSIAGGVFVITLLMLCFVIILCVVKKSGKSGSVDLEGGGGSGNGVGKSEEIVGAKDVEEGPPEYSAAIRTGSTVAFSQISNGRAEPGTATGDESVDDSTGQGGGRGGRGSGNGVQGGEGRGVGQRDQGTGRPVQTRASSVSVQHRSSPHNSTSNSRRATATPSSGSPKPPTGRKASDSAAGRQPAPPPPSHVSVQSQRAPSKSKNAVQPTSSLPPVRTAPAAPRRKKPIDDIMSIRYA